MPCRASVAAIAVALALVHAGCRARTHAHAGTRALEARLGDERHRPWRPGHAELSLEAQATLAADGQHRALAEAMLSAGRVDAAAAELAKAEPSPLTDSDAAVIALVRGDVEGALERLDDVLARAPKSGPALWNRALALRALGLPRGAAAAFDAVAALGEPGWADEAKTQAASLRQTLAARDQAWAAAQAAGKALVASGALPPPSLLEAQPTLMRHYLYHAVRAAPSLARLSALGPLAATLDARDHGDVLTRLIARTAARDLAARAPLAATYARLSVNPAALDAKAADAYVATLRARHEDDLLLGTLVLLRRDDAEVIRLARASGDPWYRAIAAEREAATLVARDKLVEAESVLPPALAECRAHRLDYRCVHVESALTDVYRYERRIDDAQRLGRAALEHAAASAPTRELELYMRLGDVARQRQSFALMEAYLDEGVRAQPGSCPSRRWAGEMAAVAHLTRLDFAAARAALDRSPRCDVPTTPMRADIVADLARVGLGGAEAAALPADLARVRATLGRGDRAYLDVVEARAIIGRDRAAGDALLDRALAATAAARDDVQAAKARSYALLTRAIEAGLAGDDATTLSALAADVGAAAPARCALGVAVDGERAVAVARGADGASALHAERARRSTALEPAELVPAPLRARLAGCDEVAVFAPPPVHGLAELLPPEVAWSYRLRAPQPRARVTQPRRLVVANPLPPPSLALPRLADWRTPPDERATLVEGAAATPSRVLAELADATEVELHTHGIIDFGLSAASVLALSPDGDGRFALSARDLEQATLRGQPTVILAACHGARAASYWHEPWGLPLAFVRAGAAAVFASPAPIGDRDAGPFFAAVLARLREGATPARALRDERMRVLTTDHGSWVRHLLVFE